MNGCALVELLTKVWPMIGEAPDRGAMATITERDIRLHRLPIGRSDEQEQ